MNFNVSLRVSFIRKKFLPDEARTERNVEIHYSCLPILSTNHAERFTERTIRDQAVPVLKRVISGERLLNFFTSPGGTGSFTLHSSSLQICDEGAWNQTEKSIEIVTILANKGI